MPTPTPDFSIFDWQELVTYAPVSDDLVENVPALRRPLTQSGMRNVERYVELLATDVVFHLDGANLALGSSRRWKKTSVGFVGTSDGWQDISQHFQMEW